MEPQAIGVRARMWCVVRVVRMVRVVTDRVVSLRMVGSAFEQSLNNVWVAIPACLMQRRFSLHVMVLRETRRRQHCTVYHR